MARVYRIIRRESIKKCSSAKKHLYKNNQIKKLARMGSAAPFFVRLLPTLFCSVFCSSKTLARRPKNFGQAFLFPLFLSTPVPVTWTSRRILGKCFDPRCFRGRRKTCPAAAPVISLFPTDFFLHAPFPPEPPMPRRIPDVPFHMPNRIPCASVTLPHRDTSPDTRPHPCFVLFQREPLPLSPFLTGRPAEKAGNEEIIRPCDK